MAKDRRAIVAISLVVVLLVSVVGAIAFWEYIARDPARDIANDLLDNDRPIGYYIELRVNGTLRAYIGMPELGSLPNMTFVDTQGSGSTEIGPLVRDVIGLHVNITLLDGNDSVRIYSSITHEERTLNWGEISIESNMYVLDYNKRGMTKFTSPAMDRDDRVRDVDLIEVSMNG